MTLFAVDGAGSAGGGAAGGAAALGPADGGAGGRRCAGARRRACGRVSCSLLERIHGRVCGGGSRSSESLSSSRRLTRVRAQFEALSECSALLCSAGVVSERSTWCLAPSLGRNSVCTPRRGSSFLPSRHIKTLTLWTNMPSLSPPLPLNPSLAPPSDDVLGGGLGATVVGLHAQQAEALQPVPQRRDGDGEAQGGRRPRASTAAIAVSCAFSAASDGGGGASAAAPSTTRARAPRTGRGEVGAPSRCSASVAWSSAAAGLSSATPSR